MSNLEIFNFNSTEVRVLTIDNNPWFVAKDLCDVLEHSNSRMALERLDDDEKGVSNVYTLGGSQEMSIVSESGMYSLVLTSRKPQAKAFKKWITSKVLPSIRKTGVYQIEPKAEVAQLPPQDIRIHQLRTDIEFFGQFGIDLTNPRYSQYVKDIVVNTIIGVASLPEVKEVWLGVAEKAESMGYPANLVLKYRSTLGKFVKLNIENYQLESVQEERICNGRSVKILLYKDCDSLTGLVRDFMSQRVR